MNNKECLYWGNCGVKLITESEGATQCNNQSNCSLIDDGFEYKRLSKFMSSVFTLLFFLGRINLDFFCVGLVVWYILNTFSKIKENPWSNVIVKSELV